MKTITIKVTKNGNYVVCILPIRGQQSSSEKVFIYNTEFDYLKTETAHPLFTWVKECESVGLVGGCKMDPDEIGSLIKLFINNNLKGYTTASVLKGNFPTTLMAPLHSL